MDTATLITTAFLIMFSAILIGFWIEQYFLRRKRTKHIH